MAGDTNKDTNTVTLTDADKEAIRQKIIGAGFRGTDVTNLLSKLDPASGFESNLAVVRSQPIWKTRFPANEQLIAAKQAPIDEGEYIQREKAYTKLMDNYSDLLTSDLNKRDKKGNLIINKDKVAELIVKEVSPQELEARFQQGIQYVDNLNPELKAQLAQYYNIGDADLKKYILNFKNSSIDWNKEFQTTKVGATAAKVGINLNKEFAQYLTTTGLTEQQLQYGIQQAGDTINTAEMLASISNEDLTQEKLLAGQLGVNTEAKKQVQQLTGTEVGRFSGTSGGTNILGSSTTGAI
jgi:hypothetical protein